MKTRTDSTEIIVLGNVDMIAKIKIKILHCVKNDQTRKKIACDFNVVSFDLYTQLRFKVTINNANPIGEITVIILSTNICCDRSSKVNAVTSK